MTQQVAIRKLSASERERALHFEALPDGYYETDLHGRLTIVNGSLSRMVSCPNPAYLVGNPASQFIDPEGWARIEANAERLLTTGEAVPLVECVVICPTNARHTVELSIALLRGKDAAPTGFCGIVREVTGRSAGDAENTHLQDQLAEMRSRFTEVSELEQLKTHMIRVVAHDLRSPLSIITGYLELLHEDLAGHYNDMDEMYVNAIRQAITRITRMTSDILSLERLHEYREVAPTRVQLDSLLEHITLEFAEEMRHRQQQLNINVEPLAVSGDSTELHEAIANLLGNAIKYTGNNGAITVTLRHEDGSAVLEIADSGYGIPANDQVELFQPFYRVKTRETHGIEGTGLGLYLVKRIVERHGGSVHFQSAYGEGSLFGFRLPLEKADAPP